jgi:4-amino-4-deoxy-L-arabinose transferase-like glycosyltransferase
MPRLTATMASWLLILVVAMCVRVGAGVWWQSRLGPGRQFFFPDSQSYWDLARSIADGESYEFGSPHRRVFRTPGYPLLLAGLFKVYGDNPPVLSARVLNALLGTLTVGAVGWWTTQLFDARTGRVAGWLAALYPGVVAMSAFVLTEAPFGLFMVFQLALWSAAWKTTSSRASIALSATAGVAAGLASLVRPSWLLFTPFALVIALIVDRGRGRQLVSGIAMMVGLVTCMLPWWVRNVQVTGHFVTTTLQVGASLYDGLNPHADGSSNMAFVGEFEAAELETERSGDQTEGFEYRLDQRLRRAATDWAAANPARALQLAAIKFARMWNVWPNEPSLRSWPLRLIVLATYAPLLVLSLVGAWRFTRRGWPYLLAWLPAVYLTLVHMVFVGSIRYREPAMLTLIVLAAGVLVTFARNEPPRAEATATA